MKRKIIVMCIALFIMGSYFHIQVHAEPDAKQTVAQTLGKTPRSAMKGIDLVYKEDWVYFINGNQQLERRHIKTQEKEILYKGNMTQINVMHGYIYGYVHSEDGAKQGIYKLNIEDKTYERISDKYAVNMIVIEDWVYFKEDDEVGILRMKTDGSLLEEVYNERASAFTVYGEHIYLSTDGMLARIDRDGEGFNTFDESYDYWSTFIIQDNHIYTLGDREDGSSLLKIALNGEKIEPIIEGFPPYYYDDIQLYDGHVYVEEDGNMLCTSFETYKEETVYGTSLMHEYIITDGQLIFSLETEDVGEIWQVDLDTMDEKRIVPKHYAHYDTLKSIVNQSEESYKAVKQSDYNMLMERGYFEDAEKTDLELRIQIDHAHETVSMHLDLLDVTMDYWFVDNDDMFMALNEDMQDLMPNQEEYAHFYGKDISQRNADIRNNSLFGDTDIFTLLRGATLRESQEQYIIYIKDGENSFDLLLGSDLGLTEDEGNLSSNTEVFMYVNKKSQLIERIKMKATGEDYSGKYHAKADITIQYNKGKVTIPQEFYNLIRQKEKSTTYIESANKAIEKEQYASAVKLSQQALDAYALNKEAYLVLGQVAYVQNDILEAIEHLTHYIGGHLNKESVEADVYETLAECYFSQGDYSNAIDSVYENMSRVDELSLRMNLIMGISQLELHNGYTASFYLDDVLAEEPLHEEALVGRIGAYVNTDEYKEAIALADEYTELLKESRAMWYYKGVAYYNIGNPEKGLELLKKSMAYPEEKNTNITEDAIHMYMAYIYCAIENYDQAEKHTKKISANGDDAYITNAKEALVDMIKYGRLPINKKLSSFVDDHYLYRKSIKNFEDKITAFDNKDNATPEEVKAFYDTIKLKDDPFTWLIQGEEFDRLMNETATEDVVYRQLDDRTEYIQINSFLPDTGNKAVEALENMEDTYDKDLVLDLRGNGGGAIQAAATILDALLGECTSVYLIDRDGETFEATSDMLYQPFRRIFVLMDEQSASSSEIVALSLKKFGDDVTLVGRKTYGKGVAQHIFIDRNNKTALFLVSNYWNVLQENIDGKGIQPDVVVEGENLEDYLDVIRGIDYREED
ncbi:DUF5050 domain-containing protein [Vallitalea pronyensis]|uniref:DUF5050 domain-containing protein n=1 Tax=Vallitalea pronyensis TaxID=1348613 RepID=A0A8J8SGU4_9FIRM|nr:S41 family peptidase [Vallitalea pronyensis]QUI23140.1 DUF5050 domain-containing protein [Vallitalea pronyensis]